MNDRAAENKVPPETRPISSWDTDPANRWSIPYIDQPLDFWEAIQSDYSPFVSEVYFPLPGRIMGSGRPPLPDSYTDTFLRRSKLDKCVLVNAVTLPRPVEDMAPVVIEALKRLNGEFGICRATVANLKLAEKIRQALGEWSLTASVLMDVSEPYQVQMLDGICDTLVPASRVVRDLPALRAIRAAYRGRIRLMVNEGCLPGCPYRPEHFHEMAAGVQGLSLCHELLYKQAWRRLTGSWILPQHLHFYAGTYDEMKLDGRMTLQDPAKFRHVLESYIQRRPLQPHEIGGGPASVLTPMDISDKFFAYTLECGQRCYQCKRCPEYYEAALRRQAESSQPCANGGCATVTYGQLLEDNMQAVVLTQQGRLEEAAVCFRRLLELNPGFAEAYSNLGNVLFVQGKYDQAEACYRQALGIKPDFADARSNLGSVLHRQGKLAEAEAHYRQALQLRPDFFGACYNLADALRAQGKLAEAVVHYRAALRLNPYCAEAHYILGNALGDQGQLAEATAEYQEALRLKPDYPEAHNNLGNALVHQGRLGEAVTHYREAVRLNPYHAEAHYNLGSALRNQGQLTEAVAQHQEAIRLKPDLAEAHNNLGNALNSMRLVVRS